MTTLNLADGLTVPLDIVTEKLAFLGRTGSGKTYGAMKLAELMLEHHIQIGAIDPVGVWRGLRVKAVTSFEVVVFGGLTPDLPLEPTAAAGELIADLVCDRGLSFVLDVSQFIPSEQQRVVRAFADRFFHRRKSSPAACHLFMEECQEFIPENPSGDEAKTLGVMQRLWKLGRNFGIGGSLISQRPQEIAKKALNMSGTLFAFQMTGPQERKAIRSWVADQGVATDIEAILQRLHVGQPHVESPTFLRVSRTVRINPRDSADLSSTPKVYGSNRALAVRPLTPIDVEQLKAAMAATIEKAKADDPVELRKRIAALERELAAKPVAAPPQIVEKPVLTDEQLRRAERLVKELKECSDQQLAVIECIQALDGHLGASAHEIAQAILATKTKAPDLRTFADTRGTFADRTGTFMPGTIAVKTTEPGDASVGKSGLRRMLIALAQRNGLTRRQLGLRAGMSSRSGTFDTYLSRARTNGWVEGNGDLSITPAGIKALGSFEPLPEGQALLHYWLNELGSSGAARILSALASAYPRGLSRQELGIAANLSDRSGTFDTYLSRLRTLELVTGKSELKASDELFS